MKKKVVVLGTWEDVDAEILAVAKLDLDIEARENALNKRRQAIDEQHAPAIQELKDERTTREAAILQFAKKHRRDFGDVKSRKFTFGTISFSKIGSAVRYLIDEALVLAKIKKAGLIGVVKSRESIDKAALVDSVPPNKRKSFGFEVETTGDEPKLSIDRKAVEAQQRTNGR